MLHILVFMIAVFSLGVVLVYVVVVLQLAAYFQGRRYLFRSGGGLKTAHVKFLHYHANHTSSNVATH